LDDNTHNNMSVCFAATRVDNVLAGTMFDLECVAFIGAICLVAEEWILSFDLHRSWVFEYRVLLPNNGRFCNSFDGLGFL